MNDFDYDVVQRKRIARSARNRKCGSKSKRCSLATDHMTPKQWRERCGSVVTYQLNRPISWTAFKEMPHDVQKMYVDKIMECYSPTATDLANLFGVTATTVTKYLSACFDIKFTPGKKMPKERVDAFRRFIGGEDQSGEEVKQAGYDADSKEEDEFVRPVYMGNNAMRMTEFTLVFDGEFNAESIHNSIASMIPNGALARVEIKCTIEEKVSVAKSQEVA